jgi:hypothetical protein
MTAERFDRGVASGAATVPATNPWKPVLNPRDDGGAHYTIFGVKREAIGMQALRGMFPDGKADAMNFVLFSTSGVHGTYNTIEEAETTILGKAAPDEACSSVTFLIVHPRIVALRYGECDPETPEDIAFLKRLRKTSHAAMSRIGSPPGTVQTPKAPLK